MRDKKSIDRLFQEKLKDFEVAPNNSVWENITNKIHSSGKQRKVIPIWWKIAGIAAGLLLLFTIGNTVLNNNDAPKESIVNTNSDETNQDSSNQDKINNLQESNNAKKIANDDSIDFSSPSNVLNKKSKRPNPIIENNQQKSSNVVINNSAPNKSENNIIITNDKLLKAKEALANTDKQNTIDSDIHKNISGAKENTIHKKQINSALNELTQSTNPQNTSIANTVIKEEQTTEIPDENKIDENGDLSLTEVIAATNEDDIIENDESKIDRWSVAPSIAPVYFNTLGTGSSIHSQFNNNSKTGDINMSYGISTSYAINDRLSVRAGINKVSLGYSTNDVVVFNNIRTFPEENPPLIRNIKFNKKSKDLSFLSIDEFNFAQVPGVLSSHLDASIDQKLGFLEIPLELQYSLSNNKLGISVIGGVSALFLNDNEVYSVQDGKSTLLGKATNINNTSYSANIGLGLDYKISQKINFNFEPVFKYQLNTFSNTSGDFKPYFIGVYSGFRFKF